MRAEVVCVGTELLLGDIVNTNAAEIGAMLAGIGVDCFAHISVGDNIERIAEALRDALARCDAVIVTGGLGPTQDDVTREAVAALTKTPLVRDDSAEATLRALFARMQRPMAQMNLRQADRPEGSVTIPAVIGTAPGFVLEHAGGVVYAIPGVPVEMREMMQRFVLPGLVARRGDEQSVMATRVVRVAGMAESAIAQELSSLWESLQASGVRMAFLAGGGEVRVRLTAKARDAAEADGLLEPVVAAVRARLGAFVVGVDDQTLEVALASLLRSRGWTIGFAESLTGGAACARMTAVAGASDYVRGAVVAYASGVKADALHVEAALLDQLVTEPVALAMAAGAREALRCDVALAYTGVAGPGRHDGVDPGTVCIAVDGPFGAVARTMRLPGERSTVRAIAVTAGLNLARLYLMESLP